MRSLEHKAQGTKVLAVLLCSIVCCNAVAEDMPDFKIPSAFESDAALSNARRGYLLRDGVAPGQEADGRDFDLLPIDAIQVTTDEPARETVVLPGVEEAPLAPSDEYPVAGESMILAAPCDTCGESPSGCSSCRRPLACLECFNCFSCLCPQKEADCIECPHVSTLQPYWNVNLFGSFVTDMLFSTSRPIAAGTPFLLAPDSPFGFDTDTFDLHARQSLFGMALAGPEICGFQAGGLAMVSLYDNALIVDRYGVLPLQAYGELKNDDLRFSAGLQFDVFAPNAPTVLPFSILLGSGNAGNNFRGQVRVERYLRPSDDTQWTLQFALSEPISTTVTDDLSIIEDNGWPNVEGRIAWGAGMPEQLGLETRRPLEIGVSSVVGQVRRTELGRRVVSDVWGLGADIRWKVNDRCGFQGELFSGQGLGTYNAGILQVVNADTFQAIRTSGGWLEFWYYWTPCVHSHVGYAIDDPLDRDVLVAAPTFAPNRNETYFANALWDITPSVRLGFEFTWRETAYINAPDAEGAGFHTQFRWNF